MGTDGLWAGLETTPQVAPRAGKLFIDMSTVRPETEKALAAKGVGWNVGKVFHGDKLAYQFDLLPEPGHHRPAFVNSVQSPTSICRASTRARRPSSAFRIGLPLGQK